MMRTLLRTHAPLLGFGMASLVLGVIGLLVFFMPVLGLPISACGLFFGIMGFIAALFVGGSSIRWSLAGIGMSALALGINLAIAYAPGGYIRERRVPQLWEQVPGRPYIPPPAREM